MKTVIKLGSPHISSDGSQVRFAAETLEGEAFECVFPSLEVAQVAKSLIHLAMSVSVNQGKKTAGKSVPDQWEAQPIPVLVRKFYTSRNTSTGGLTLRVDPLSGPPVDVFFQPFHFDALRAMVLDETPMAPGPGTH